jgi:DNA-binding transcriptional regulator YiaG
MPNVNAVLAQEINRLSKRVVNINTKVTKRLVTQHRRDIAALKRQVHSLTQRLASVEKTTSRAAASLTVHPEVLEKGRFRAMGVKAHRRKLGLSAEDYGKLVGVSGLTIYNWESGKAKPRNKATVAKWLAVRGLGKREAMQRLGLAEPKPVEAPAAKKPSKGQRRRGTFKQTAEEMILSLLKARRVLTTSQLAAAWKKSGRAGPVDNTLSLMVKAKKLKRKPLGGKKGSQYRAA